MPKDIPTSPAVMYDEYQGIADWLGYAKKKNKPKKGAKLEDNWMSFNEARELVRNLNFKSTAEWEDYKKGKLTHLSPIPNNIPKTPSSFY